MFPIPTEINTYVLMYGYLKLNRSLVSKIFSKNIKDSFKTAKNNSSFSTPKCKRDNVYYLNGYRTKKLRIQGMTTEPIFKLNTKIKI